MDHYVIGIDFGTESVRAILVNTSNGALSTSEVVKYSDGVIDEFLPTNHVKLPPDYALQNPDDWLSSMETAVRTAVRETRIESEQIIGIGIDFTSCTILPTTAQGTPLCALGTFSKRPHAWPKLWKHHAAQPQADRITETAKNKNQAWLQRYGGKVSSEWLPSKALQILEEDGDVYSASEVILEGGDWVVWQLTGKLVHNACAAGYKSLWNKKDGFPSPEFLNLINPGLGDLYQKLPGPILPPGTSIGGLLPAWAMTLGVPAGIPVVAAIIDAHAATLGAGVTQPGVMFMIMGTSTCHLLMSEKEYLVPGISGVVEDGIVPGLFGFEAGQVGVGDMFSWFIKNCVPDAYANEADSRKISLHALLTEKASKLKPGQSGLLALDWWNGNRTPLVNAELSGLLIGATLTTKPEEIYRALIESTAFGTRRVIETFTSKEIPVRALVAGGGLVKNQMLMQIYADITQREISVASSPQVSALGGALLAAVAAGSAAGGYSNLTEAAKRMVPPPSQNFKPNPTAKPVYEALYLEYLTLSQYFGEGGNQVMKTLRNFRREIQAS